MITYSSKYRSSQEEIMDDFSLQGATMELLLSDLETVNKWLGGYRITTSGIELLLKNIPKQKHITILDMGCGDGSLLRKCAKWAKKNGRNISFIGIDANTHSIKIAKERTTAYTNIKYQTCNVLTQNVAIPPCDIALCTLFLHHFPEKNIIQLVQELTQKSRVGVVINDLHRSRWAFHLFKLFSVILIKTPIAKHDGLVSVARGFKRKELLDMKKNINGTHQIHWKWAFRYQWIIKKQNNY